MRVVLASFTRPPPRKSLIGDVKFKEMSFMCNRNRAGPKTVTCGTPDVTFLYVENCCLLAIENLKAQLMMSSLNPINKKSAILCLPISDW